MVKIMEVETKDGRKVGNIYQIRFYRTYRKYPEHYFRIFRGVGISKNILFKLMERDVEWIIIDYKGKDKKKHELWITLEDFMSKSAKYMQDGDEQFICGLGWFFEKKFNGFFDGSELYEEIEKEKKKVNGMARWL